MALKGHFQWGVENGGCFAILAYKNEALRMWGVFDCCLKSGVLRKWGIKKDGCFAYESAALRNIISSQLKVKLHFLPHS